MTEKLKQIIKREVAKLPKENQEAINTVDWGKITEEIGKKYLLNENDLNDFQVQTLLVLIGLEDADFYPQNIEYEVGTSKEEAKKISEEVFQKIFNPIINALTENIKKNDKVKNANLEQNVSFVLSGGNYSVFTGEETTVAPPGAPANSLKTNIPVKTISTTNEKPTYAVDPYREKPE